MSGLRNGVQAILKREENRALYVHCLAHNLNLCIQKTTQQCEIIRNVMDFLLSYSSLLHIHLNVLPFSKEFTAKQH